MANTTISSFNDLLQQFLDELEVAFPDDAKIKKYQASFILVRKSSVRKPLTEFMASIGPYASHIMTKNEEFFLTSDSEFVKNLNIPKLWGKASDANKDAIWQYLQTLYIIGTTITSLPPEALSVIESVAKQCAESMQGSDLMALLGKNPMKM
jgi:hypothetical protein